MLIAVIFVNCGNIIIVFIKLSVSYRKFYKDKFNKSPGKFGATSNNPTSHGQRIFVPHLLDYIRSIELEAKVVH